MIGGMRKIAPTCYWLAGAVAAAALAAGSIGSAATVTTVKGTVDPGFGACPRRTIERIGPCLP
jgi:hypothetical protein